MSTITQARTAYDGRLFKVQVLTVDDGHGGHLQREVVRHPGAVLIVPVLDDAHLVMIRNYRVAVGDWLWEFPAGKLEPGEEPIKAAARELLEETGYQARTLRPLTQFYTSPGFTDELMHVFVAENLTRASQQLEPGEHIEVEAMPVVRALELAGDGQLRDGKSIAGLLLWHAQRMSLGAALERRA